MAAKLTRKRSFETDAESSLEPKRSKLQRLESSTGSPSGSSYYSSSSKSDAPSFTKTRSWNVQRSLIDESDSESTSSYETSSSSSASEESQDESDEEIKREEESSSSSSSQSKTDDEEITSIPHIRRPLKPPIRLMNDSTLRNRLSNFLPAMKAANEELQQDIAAGKLTSAEVEHKEGEEPHGQYIEMNLGLGVLEEKKENGAESSSSESDDSSSGDEADKEDNGHGARLGPKEKSVMGKLMGDKSKIKRPIIEEMP